MMDYMIVILKDSDLKREDLKVVPLEHIELSDFRYFHEDKMEAIGKAPIIILVREHEFKVLKLAERFPNDVFSNDRLASFLVRLS